MFTPVLGALLNTHIHVHIHIYTYTFTHTQAAGAERAIVFQDSNFKITGHRWDVSEGQPFNPSIDFQKGPASGSYCYGDRKYFWPVKNNGKEGVVWQDPATLKVFLTWLNPNPNPNPNPNHTEGLSDMAEP